MLMNKFILSRVPSNFFSLIYQSDISDKEIDCEILQHKRDYALALRP